MPRKVIIIGGGLGGLVSALHLSQAGLEVQLIEKYAFPRHKVCGEYISKEVLPYLQSLGFDPFAYGAKDIMDFTLSTPGSRAIQTKLPLGGFGISRYCIDEKLADLSRSHGTEIIQDTVEDILYEADGFEVKTKSGEVYRADLVIGSFGKRSNLDVKMDRAFIKKDSPFLAVKAHYKGDMPETAVGLHNFKGGYCGVSKVENDHINVCYIADFKSFKRFKNISDFQEQVLSKNTYLAKVFAESEMAFEKPLSISQISFESKAPVENHVLMCGDSAGMIHPLAGNGMSMAIRAAQMLSQLIVQYDRGEIKSRGELENAYAQQWNGEFAGRLRSGHIISRLFRLGIFSEMIMLFLKAVPSVLPKIIAKTHGKPILVNN